MLQLMSLWNTILGMIKGEKLFMYFNSKYTVKKIKKKIIFIPYIKLTLPCATSTNSFTNPNTKNKKKKSKY